MAERRMFAKTIVLSDAFLDMPMSARCLYFTLAMLADDDGFVNSPKSIMRQAGASTDDLNLLIIKRFILTFDSGVIVIKHWRIHNYIQKDRYKESKYIEEKSALMLDQNGAYTECIQDVSTLDTQVRLGKVSTGKVIENIVHSDPAESEQKEKKPSLADIDSFFNALWDMYPVKKGKGQVSESKRRTLYAIGFEQLQRAIERYQEELKKDADWRKPQNGSTFFNSGYVDYLDENFVPDQRKTGRKEQLPGWFKSGERVLDDDELDAIQKMTEADQKEAEQLRRELEASFGRKV